MMHKYGELYAGEPENGQRRLVKTTLHVNCGGQVVPGESYLWKAANLKHDGTLGCALCNKQPLAAGETYEDWR